MPGKGSYPQPRERTEPKMSEMLECSICCDEIGCSRATLSCSHTFHLGCIGRWILRNESCPMCRREMEEKERIAEDVEEDDEDDDEWVDEGEDEDDGEDGEDDEEGREIPSLHWRRIGPGHWVVVKNVLRIPTYDEEAHALWVMRKTFEMLEDGKSVEAEGVAAKVDVLDTPESVALRCEGILPLPRVEQASNRQRAESF